jgi:succinoglycan biosynthesis transport protein ExoP
MHTSAPHNPPRHHSLAALTPRAAEVHVLDRLRALLRYRWIAAGVFVVVLAGAGLHTYSETPLYRATARILIELEDERSLAVEGVGTVGTSEYSLDPEPYFQTQYRILTGRELARRAASTLDRRALPEFNGSAPPNKGVWWLRDRLRAFAGRQLRWLRGAPEPKPPTPGALAEDSAADLITARVSVAPVKASRLVDVHFVSTDGRTAAAVANALVDEFVEQNLELRQQSMDKSIEWLVDELGRQQRTVEASERAMADYRAAQQTTALSDPQNIVTARLNQLNDAATRARTVRAQKESLLRQIETLGANAADAIPSISANTYIQSIKARLADLHRQRALLTERYGDKHPEMVSLTASIQDVTQQLTAETNKAVDSIRHEYESAVLEERTLANALADQQSVATDLDRRGVAYTMLERQAASNRQLYETLLTREKELQVLANSRGNNVRIVERASVPAAAATPDVARSLMLGVVVALFAAFGLVVLLDYLDDTIKAADDLTRKLGLPCLGLVPALKSPAEHPLVSAGRSGQFGEAIRSLRTSIAFSHSAPGSAMLMVTSAQPLEGKTTTACNLAVALAYGGARVLLVDADLRRPSVHTTFGLQSGAGLADVLAGGLPLRDAVTRIQTPSLWILPAGTPPQNPSELLSSSAMEGLTRQLREGPFDWVIVDTPPVLAVTDASVLAKHASGVVFVLGANMTRRRAAERAVETLAIGGPRILGAVLNRVAYSSDVYYSYDKYHAEHGEPTGAKA